MAKGDDIQERLIDFAVSIIKLTSQLPKNPAGNHVAGQLLRSGTSPAPNYAEARGAESNKDFIHKLRIALKELKESDVWLKISKRSQLLKDSAARPVYNECIELQKILTTSIKTAFKKERD
jgi:four helix bundle protein